MAYPRIASLKTIDAFLDRLNQLELDLPVDAEIDCGSDAPLAAPLNIGGRSVGNRFCVLPMEGWDGTLDGKPTERTRRRWRRFGISGAKWIWGGEAVAVRHDGRANPNQLLINEANLADLASLREELVESHRDRFGAVDDCLIGLQLTHSGRYAKPNDKFRTEPRIAQRNPALDRRLGIQDDSPLLTDDELKQLIDDFVMAAGQAYRAGFEFVDVKHCHGYLGHELLSGYDRAGAFGGSFENRTRFLREIVQGIASEVPELRIGVRVSVFDFLPFHPGPDGVGVPDDDADPRLLFGGDEHGLGMNLEEPAKFMNLLSELNIDMVCTTAGSPYYNPHIQRPAYFPPSDGYQPPEDPLVSVVRQIQATAELKRRHPELVYVGSGYTYLQDWLPHVAQAVVQSGMVDSVGLGRMMLSYPELPDDVLRGQPMKRKQICRTFSDCTTAPRHGLISGCFPLDAYYKQLPERETVQQIKRSAAAGTE